MPEVKLIAAVDENLGIAQKGKIPWRLPTDQKYFQDHVKPGPVVMGWNTFAANNYKPYGQGPNTVITREDKEAVPGVWVVHDAKEFFEKNKSDIWVAGGGQIFKEALPYATELYITRVEGTYDCDVFFPEFEDKFELVSGQPEQIENDIKFRYQIWKRKV